MRHKPFILLTNKRKISSRFRAINIALFAIVSALVFMVTLSEMNHLADQVSREYAMLYSANRARTLDSYFESVETLFAEYDHDHMRGLVIDENGVIHRDSSLPGEEGFLPYTAGEDVRRIQDAFPDSAFLSGLDEYLSGMDGAFTPESLTTIIEMPGGPYRYATVAPIASTTWSVVTFYNPSSLFGIANLFPLLITVFLVLLLFVVTTSLAGNALIFKPLAKLTHSIERIKANRHECVYGIGRNDEIGNIANTVQDMKDSLIDALDKVHYDALTGIYNRRFLEESMGHVLKLLSRSGGVLSVMMVDIDSFKIYNDTYGHDAGDNCLKTIAKTLANSIERANDFVTRYGGEEFAIILPNTDENGARMMASRLLENVRALSIPSENSGVADCVTISIGVTTGSVMHTQKGEDYLKMADQALYLSKNNGRNQYNFLAFETAPKQRQ